MDVDPAELGKVRRPDVPIVGDCRLVIEELVVAVRDLLEGGAAFPDRSAWKQTISGWQEKFPSRTSSPSRARRSSPSSSSSGCATLTPDDTIVASGVGQHQMWTSQYWKFNHPYTWVNSGGLGTMGFSVPAAIGAKVGRPDRMVWAVDGDGCFQMTAQELVTATSERIPIKVAILNNAYLGMVCQWQEMFYDERYSEVYLSPDLPDYKLWAEAMRRHAGGVARRGRRRHPEGQRDRRPPRGHRLPHRLAGEGLPDGPRGLSNDQIVTDPSQGEGATDGAAGTDARHHTLVVLVENKAGVLACVSGLFARRGFNIFSLAVAPTEDERFSRITVVVDVESAPLEQITKQLYKLINVVKISELDPRDS